MRQPIGVAGAGATAGDINQILDREATAIENAASGGLSAACFVGDKSTEVGLRRLRRLSDPRHLSAPQQTTTT